MYSLQCWRSETSAALKSELRTALNQLGAEGTEGKNLTTDPNVGLANTDSTDWKTANNLTTDEHKWTQIILLIVQ